MSDIRDSLYLLYVEFSSNKLRSVCLCVSVDIYKLRWLHIILGPIIVNSLPADIF